MPPILEPFLRWSRETIDNQLNSLLLNWYDGRLGHYIGRHRDSLQNLIADTPIVTLSFGKERIFRLHPWPAQPGTTSFDFQAGNRTVFVTPWEINLAFQHEVPASSRRTGQRISVTLRGFVNV